MALGSFIAGRYSATAAASSLGISESGWDLIFAPQYEKIDESDVAGLTLIDLIFRGARAQIVGRSLEYAAAGILGAIWPWGSYGAIGVIARMSIVSSLAQALVLTSTAGTPAAASPTTLTVSRSQVTEDSLALAHNSKLRRVPLAFHVLPSDSLILWTTT